MKKCPTCDKTFEDSMRFCQVDGTPLVDDAPVFDPYATIVGHAAPEAADPSAEEVVVGNPVVADEPVIHQTVGSLPITPPEDVLDLPEADPLKTMYVSDSEMRAALGDKTPDAEPEIIEIPPIEDTPSPDAPVEEPPVKESPVEEPPSPELPSFNIPDDIPPPSFKDFGPPPSPFSEPDSRADEFVPPPHVFEEPAQTSSQFDEAQTMIQPAMSNPFDPPPSSPVAEWMPPPAPDASWQNQEIGANTPFQPPPGGMSGQNQTLAIVSLVTGIVGLLFCGGLISPVALITGFMARKRAAANPAEYGGETLGLVGIILGALGTIVLLLVALYVVFVILMGVGIALGS